MSSFFKLLWWKIWNYKWCMKCHKMRAHRNDYLFGDTCYTCGYSETFDDLFKDELNKLK